MKTLCFRHSNIELFQEEEEKTDFVDMKILFLIALTLS